MMTERSSSSVRVAYFAGSLLPGQDGVTRVLYRMIDGLQRRGIPTIFFSPLLPPPGERPVPMVEVDSLKFPLYHDYRLAKPGYKRFEQALREFKPDILHINSPCSLGCAAIHYGKKYGIPVVATYHTHFPSYARYYKMVPLTGVAWNYLRSLYSGCDRVYVPSRFIMDELQEQGIPNLHFLPHGVDISSFRPDHRSLEWRDALGLSQKQVVLFVGRLVWEKELQTLADTYELLRRRRNDVALVIAGDGPAGPVLRAMLPDAVFLGHLSGQALSTVYASSDVFVMPSTTETFGNVTIEAMASGLVPVCAAAGGACGLVQNGITGRLVPPRDPRAMAEAIGSLLDDDERRAMMAAQALQFARGQTWERILDDLFEDYEEVIRNYRPGKPRLRNKDHGKSKHIRRRRPGIHRLTRAVSMVFARNVA